ncbi:hypothetical protein DWU99_01690 [Dyella psychrodurans]|uniref:Uncharacterized protein n=2 Tax=Dyella psychrodurans TaxID=1927960 RepID=A0A370XC67_9GAMM|nr:hypothetical protein DWU99_01690 [Dyella psychrodurans]
MLQPQKSDPSAAPSVTTFLTLTHHTTIEQRLQPTYLFIAFYFSLEAQIDGFWKHSARLMT